MIIAKIYRGKKLRPPAKKIERYEDMPITKGVLADFIGFVAQDRAFYFRLSQKTGVVPQNVLPDAAAKPVIMDPLNLSHEEFKDMGPLRSRYLYAINDKGIHVALEQARSIAKRGSLTHTNLCREAYFGGEVFFLSRNRVVLTPNSGRFGLSPGGPKLGLRRFQALWKMTIECWRSCGFIVYPTIEDVTDEANIMHRVWNGRALARATAEMFAEEAK